LAGLPEAQRIRMTALDLAVKASSVLRPRMHRENAVGEIFGLAEQIADYLYGGRDERLAAMPYPQYLTTTEWDERRRAAYRRAGYRCQLCNAENVELHAHHRSYQHRGRPTEADDLIVLCARCHEQAHRFIWRVE
jgi:hypothetical protein